MTCVFVVLLAPSIANAEEAHPLDNVVEESAPPTYIPLGFLLPQLGFGMVTRGNNDMDLGKYAFDGTVRESLGAVVGSPRLRLGGFAEVRTAGFETLELGLGPQAMFAFSELWSMQARAGVAGVLDGGSYALAGIQVGTPFFGLTMTGRRYFDDHHVELSVNVEITSLILLLPFGPPDLVSGTNR